MNGTRDADVVVVGAGPSGLTAAAFLALHGRRVVVVDAREVPGGHMSAFTHGGFEFDIGLHFTQSHAARAVLDPLGVDVSFHEHGPDQQTVVLPGRTVTLQRGEEAVRARLHDEFPAERATVDTFLDTVLALEGELEHLPERPRLRDFPEMTWGSRHLIRHARSTLGSYLDHLEVSPELRVVLASLAFEGLLPPSRLSLLIYARLASRMNGTAYPEGGSARISEGLADVVRDHGGEILLETEVDQVLVEGGRARGVRARPASWGTGPDPAYDVRADTVISTVDMKQTFLRLVDPAVLPERLVRRVRAVETAFPLFVVYLVLDRDLAAEGLTAPNTLVVDGLDVEAPYQGLAAGRLSPTSALYLWNASLSDPRNPRLCAPGQTNLQLSAVAPSAHDFWGVAPGRPSGPRYAARRRELRNRLLDLAERAVPDLRRSILFEEAATPITEERLMRTTGASAYGPALTPTQVFARPGFVTPVEGLFLAGASGRGGPGLVGTLRSGVGAASAVTGVPVGDLLGEEAEEPQPMGSGG